MSKVPAGEKQGLVEIRLTRMQHGGKLTRILTSCVGMTRDYPDDLSDEETGGVKNLLMDLDEFLELGDKMELHDTMGFEQRLGEQLRVLNGYGFNVFLGTSGLVFTDGRLGLRAAHVLVARSSDPRSQPNKSGNITVFLVNAPPPEKKYGGDASEASDGASPDESDEHYSLRRAGDYWGIVFEGGEEFLIKDMLGLRFLHYLLKHPEEIKCAELEIEVDGSKKGMRSANSIVWKSDSKAVRDYQQEALKLKKEYEDAEMLGDPYATERLLEALKTVENGCKRKSSVGGSSMEKARDNVRKAINRVCKKLNKMGGPSEKAFAKHILDTLEMGYSVRYKRPEKVTWK